MKIVLDTNVLISGIYFSGLPVPETLSRARRPGLGGERGVTWRGPEAVEPDPEEALEATETEPFAVSGNDHCQLLTQSEELQV